MLRVSLQKVRRSEIGEAVILNADENRVETPFHDAAGLPPEVVNIFLISRSFSLFVCQKIIFHVRLSLCG
jgi:hypothetical protein